MAVEEEWDWNPRLKFSLVCCNDSTCWDIFVCHYNMQANDELEIIFSKVKSVWFDDMIQDIV